MRIVILLQGGSLGPAAYGGESEGLHFMPKIKVCILRTAGTNCDMETAYAFAAVGAVPELAHVNALTKNAALLSGYQILAIPGGFTYGDDVAAGRILANELRAKLADELKNFVRSQRLIIGICNGFQVLVKCGLLPGNDALTQEASLIINDSGKFEDRWSYLRTHELKSSQVKNVCIWAKNLPKIIYLPIAHGEGKFVIRDKAVLERLKKNGQIVFQYCDGRGELKGYPVNPNGSLEHIAGICDETGHIFGLMPHPERHISPGQHPRWAGADNKKEGDGLQIFRNAVEYFR